MSNPKVVARSKQQIVDCEDYRTKRMRVIGLQSLGYTSCLNSVLQNLLYLRPFRDQLIRTMNRTEYKLVPKKHPDLETLTFTYSDKKTEPGRLTKELFKLMNETVYQLSLKTATPWPVRNEIVGKSVKFSDVTQQDSHELFRFLIDMVKEEEIKRLKTAFNGLRINFKNYPEDRKKLLEKYTSEFENILVFTGTLIDDTFGGKMISTVECDNCKKISYINEDFLDISLHLSADSEEFHTNNSLECYLKQFFFPKLLEKEYVCNSCNPQLVSGPAKASVGDKDERKDDTDNIDFDTLIYTNAVKQFYIKTIGPVLTIHLKRFSQTGYGLQKIDKRVEFPLVLDMSPFCVSDTSILKNCDDQILYGLRGIIKHPGMTVSRDYVAYVNIADWNMDSAKITSKDSRTAGKRPNSHLYEHVTLKEEWYLIKDSSVSRVNHDEVFSSQPYILFYERLPLLIRVRVEEVGEKRRNNSEPSETRDAAARSQVRPNPSLDQSYIKSGDCKESGIKSMRVIGLRNLGNTCYLNSVLQNLLYLRPFRELLHHTMTRTEYKLVPMKCPDLETLTFAYSDKKTEPGKLTEELFKLINETTYQKSPRTVTPEAVRNEIVGKSVKFSDVTQQDSHELFRFLIDMVKEEEIKRLKTAFFDHFDINDHKTHFKNYPEDRKKLLRKYASEFENILVFTGTFIDDTFGGKMISTVECDNCRKILYMHEDFLDISLHLSADSEEFHTNNSLECYLKQFFFPKLLEKEYVCNSCNPQLVSGPAKASVGDKDERKDDTDNIDFDTLIYTNAVKQFYIKTIGPVLTIHLKRFSQTGYGLQKVDKRVEFPLVLDMSPFCVSDTSILKNCDDQILYGLRGIIKHPGMTVSRDYVAYVNIADWNMDSAKITSKDSRTAGKRPNSHLYEHVTLKEEWYLIKDSSVSRTNHDEVFSSQPYILFYERLPLLIIVRVEEVGEKRRNNSEPSETRDAAARSQVRPNPSLDQSYIHSDDCKEIRTKSMGVIGLDNLGNTCYLNSVLQNLLYLRPFRDQLIYTMTHTEYKLVPKKLPDLETFTFPLSDKKTEPGKLTRGLFKLIKETTYEISSGKIVTPKIVMPCAVQNEIADKCEKFSTGLQQDSHELFRYLINMVKDEEIQRLKKCTSEFDNISKFPDTFIDDIFGGKMISAVKCSDCDKCNTIYLDEDLLDISLPLPAIEDNIHNCQEIIPSNNQPRRKIELNSEIEEAIESKEIYPEDSLEFYLKQFFSPKLLEKEYVCNSCNPQLVSEQASYTISNSVGDKDERKGETDNINYDTLIYTNAVKQFCIKTIGAVLTIHLKRFCQTKYGLQKVDRRVKFPLVLDMSPFCVSDTSIRKDFNDQIYGLRGIVRHSGGMLAGHYVAFVNMADWNISPTSPLTPYSHLKHVKPPEDWYYISDSYISKTDHDHVFRSQAYLLFYERLPLVTRDRVEEISKKHKNISESATREMKAATNEIHENPKPSFSQSYFIEKNQPVDYEGGLIKSMCVIGLSNLGNSCFLNSVLQNLLYLRPFRNQLTYTMDCTEYKLVPKKHSNLETITFSYSDKITGPGKLTRELFKLIQEATNEKSSRKNVPPKIAISYAVKNEIAGKPGKFSNGLQQDGHELFRFIMNMVRDEEIKRLKAAFWKYFNIIDDKTQFKNFHGDKKYVRKYDSEFENSCVFNGTFIDDTFGGEMISKVNCSACNNIIDIFKDFLDISLPLPSYIEDNKDCIQEDNNIEYYLKQFFSSPKLLEKDYVCSNCNLQLVGKQEKASYTDSHKGKSVKEDSTEKIGDDSHYFSDAYKQFRIKTLAPVLTIHLQRFYQSESGLQKMNKRVEFPLVLDMSHFCLSGTSILKDCDGKVLYGLRGIVDHTSGITTGHCMAYVNLADWDVPSKIPCKDNTKSRTAEESSQGKYSTYKPMDAVPAQHDEVNKLPHALESNLRRHVEFTDEWYFISDSSYHETDRYHVLNSQAYILFYERLPIVEGCTEL